MKPSKNAMFSYWLGIVTIFLGLIFFILTSLFEGFLLALGACAMLFIFGIQTDLYEHKSLDPLEQET